MNLVFSHSSLKIYYACERQPFSASLSCVFQVKELNHYLEAEKSCRTDLEMYVAVLNTQKSVLQEDAEKLRKELHEGLTCPTPAPLRYSKYGSCNCAEGAKVGTCLHWSVCPWWFPKCSAHFLRMYVAMRLGLELRILTTLQRSMQSRRVSLEAGLIQSVRFTVLPMLRACYLGTGPNWSMCCKMNCNRSRWVHYSSVHFLHSLPSLGARTAAAQPAETHMAKS